MPDPIPSTIPKVRRVLTALVAGDPRFTNVQVSYGDPGKDTETECVAIGGVVDWQSGWASIGARRRDESYGITVYVRVARGLDGQQEATERAFELYGFLELLFRELVTEGLNVHGLTEANGTGVQTLGIDPVAAPELLLPDGRGQLIEAEVSITARI